MTAHLLDALRAAVGAEHVMVDADLRAGYEVDWLGKWSGTALCVVRPATTVEVSAVVSACRAAGAVIVPQGGNTGLVGGSVPHEGERPVVVLSTRRLTRLDPVDPAMMQVTVGAGVTIEAVQQHARVAGLDMAVDWGARASATVGGAVSTNAGGSRVVRFGTMRAQVMGLEVVLADGSVVSHLSGLPKETAGMHLPSLFCGAEGTLGVVTAVRLRLVPWFRETAAAWVACESVDDAVSLLGELRGLAALDAVEMLMPEAVRVACDHLGVAPPIDPSSVGPRGVFVMVDCAAHHDPVDELAALLGAHRGVLAVGPQRELLYRIRDHVTIAIGALGTPVKLDVALPLSRLGQFVGWLDDSVSTLARGARLIVFGHLAEGNLHVNVLGADERAAALTSSVLSSVISLGGAISAEHGIGVAKASWLRRAKGDAAVDAMLAVRRALDPTCVFNPGVLTPLD